MVQMSGPGASYSYLTDMLCIAHNLGKQSKMFGGRKMGLLQSAAISLTVTVTDNDRQISIEVTTPTASLKRAVLRVGGAMATN